MSVLLKWNHNFLQQKVLSYTNSTLFDIENGMFVAVDEFTDLYAAVSST